jgi:hypothetical protein
VQLDYDDHMCLVERRFPGFAGLVNDGGLTLLFAKDPPRNLRAVQEAIDVGEREPVQLDWP